MIEKHHWGNDVAAAVNDKSPFKVVIKPGNDVE